LYSLETRCRVPIVHADCHPNTNTLHYLSFEEYNTMSICLLQNADNFSKEFFRINVRCHNHTEIVLYKRVNNCKKRRKHYEPERARV
jgi:hypothetical protein